MNGLYPPLRKGWQTRQDVRMQARRERTVQPYFPGLRKQKLRSGRRAGRRCSKRAVQCMAFPISFHGLSSRVLQAWHAVFWLLGTCAHVLARPPGGGRAVGPVTWLPGWEQTLQRGPRRLLGLMPGRAQPVPVPGAWYTPSGVANALQQVPTGIWLLLIAYLGFRVADIVKQRRMERDKYIQERTLIAAAKSSDLRLQKNRMLRALGAEPDQEDSDDCIEVDAAEVRWSDPTEWQPVTWKQWADFMDKSRALQMTKEQWWDVDMMTTHVPHHKTAYDQLEASGQLPDYNL